MAKTTKTEQVRQHLKTHKQISSLDAIRLYNATRLSSIIFNLKGEGWLINTEPRTIQDCNDNPCTYALYKLVSTPEENKLLNK
jgi:Helix-turn-helix domain